MKAIHSYYETMRHAHVLVVCVGDYDHDVECSGIRARQPHNINYNDWTRESIVEHLKRNRETHMLQFKSVYLSAGGLRCSPLVNWNSYDLMEIYDFKMRSRKFTRILLHRHILIVAWILSNRCISWYHKNQMTQVMSDKLSVQLLLQLNFGWWHQSKIVDNLTIFSGKTSSFTVSFCKFTCSIVHYRCHSHERYSESQGHRNLLEN